MLNPISSIALPSSLRIVAYSYFSYISCSSCWMACAVNPDLSLFFSNLQFASFSEYADDSAATPWWARLLRTPGTAHNPRESVHNLVNDVLSVTDYICFWFCEGSNETSSHGSEVAQPRQQAPWNNNGSIYHNDTFPRFSVLPLILQPSVGSHLTHPKLLLPESMMKLIPLCIALGVTLLPSFVHARLDPQELSHLTMVTNYTFHSICNDFNNPDFYFDEAVPEPPATKPAWPQTLMRWIS